MILELPIYVERQPGDHQSATYLCRPLFAAAPYGKDPQLQKAMQRLARRWKNYLEECTQQHHHEFFLTQTLRPDFETKSLKMKLDLKDRFVKCKFLFVILKQLDRTVVFTPSIPHLWFDLRPTESVECRATEVLQAYFRQQAKKGAPFPRWFSCSGDSNKPPSSLAKLCGH